MQNQPRRLSFMKCSTCRKDRQKCTPLDRTWPGRRCDRCIKFEYSCSANTNAKGQEQRLFETMKPAGTIKDGQGWKHTPFTFTAGSTGQKGPYPEAFPAQISDGPPTIPKCAELFGGLKDAGWRYLQYLKMSECVPEDNPEHVIRLGIALMTKESLAMFYSILNDRVHCIRIHQMYREGVEGNIALGYHEKKAERLTIANMIRQLSQYAEDEDGESVTDFVVSIVHIVRQGGRWLELIDVVGAQEILLIGRKYGDDENDDADNKNEVSSVAMLEKNFQKDYKSMDIAKIIERGDDNVFKKMKELLLMPDLRLKETCRRLSGLSQLIDRLGGMKEGLGLEDNTSTTTGELVKPKTNKNFHLLSSWTSEIEQRISTVFRNADSESEDAVEGLVSLFLFLVASQSERRRKEFELETDVEETFSDETDVEGICKNNIGDQNGEADDDFCVNFLTDDALKMFGLK